MISNDPGKGGAAMAKAMGIQHMPRTKPSFALRSRLSKCAQCNGSGCGYGDDGRCEECNGYGEVRELP